MHKQSVAPDTVLHIIRDVCRENQIPAPPDFERNYRTHFSAIPPLNNHLQLNRLCAAAMDLVADDIENRLFFLEIKDEVRNRIARLMGAEELINLPVLEFEHTRISARGLFGKFLENLDEGYPWAISDMAAWKNDGIRLKNRIKYLFGTSFTGIKAALGEQNRELLKSHPLKINIQGIPDLARILTEFMDGLEDLQSWHPEKLSHWKSASGVTGKSVVEYIRNNFGEALNENILRRIFRNRTQIVDRHPLKKVKQFNNAYETRDFLEQFFATLEPGNSWNPAMLHEWSRKNGFSGENIYESIRRKFEKGFNQESLRMILGEKAETLLTRNPLTIKEYFDPDFVKRYLNDYLASLRPGQKWSSQTFQRHEPRAKSIYCWIQRNIRHDDTIDWLFILLNFLPAEALKRNPFYHRKKNYFHDEKCAVTSRKKKSPEEMHHRISRTEETANDPEELLMEKEEIERIRALMSQIETAIAQLPQEEQKTIQSFRNEENVDEKKMAAILKNLRKRIESPTQG